MNNDSSKLTQRVPGIPEKGYPPVGDLEKQAKGGSIGTGVSFTKLRYFESVPLTFPSAQVQGRSVQRMSLTTYDWVEACHPIWLSEGTDHKIWPYIRAPLYKLGSSDSFLNDRVLVV